MLQGELNIQRYIFWYFIKAGLVDLDICGPSIPKLMAIDGQQVVNSPYGWMPLR